MDNITYAPILHKFAVLPLAEIILRLEAICKKAEIKETPKRPLKYK